MNRREFLARVGGGAAATAAVMAAEPFIGGAAGLAVRATRPEVLPPGSRGINVNVLTGGSLKDQQQYLTNLYTDAKVVAQKMTLVGPTQPQGTSKHPEVSVVSFRNFAAAALLLTEIEWGTDARNSLRDQIIGNGKSGGREVRVRYDDTPEPNRVEGETQPFEILLPAILRGANIGFTGREASQNTDDFPALVAINNFVNTTITQEKTSVDRDSVDGSIANIAAPVVVGVGAGMLLARRALTSAATHPLTTNEKAAYIAGGAAIAGLAAGEAILSQRENWGGRAEEIYTSIGVNGSDLGSGYDHLSPTFKPYTKAIGRFKKNLMLAS